MLVLYLSFKALMFLTLTLSLHDALPILRRSFCQAASTISTASRKRAWLSCGGTPNALNSVGSDRKSTRLNSSHRTISYAVFCLKKKKKKNIEIIKTNHCNNQRPV